MDKDILYVIDLDRTLLNVDKVLAHTEDTCKKIGIDFSYVLSTAEVLNGSIKSFSPMAAIEGKWPEKLEEFKEVFVKTADKAELIYPDGALFLEKLAEKGNQYMILTFAVEKSWQELKLRATGLDMIPHIITFNTSKGLVISDWKDDSGVFNPGLQGVSSAPNIMFIDDKLSAFDNLPENCHGFWIRRESGDSVKLPPRVTEIDSFDRIIDKI